jgi:hypothetical protein
MAFANQTHCKSFLPGSNWFKRKLTTKQVPDVGIQELSGNLSPFLV